MSISQYEELCEQLMFNDYRFFEKAACHENQYCFTVVMTILRYYDTNLTILLHICYNLGQWANGARAGEQ